MIEEEALAIVSVTAGLWNVLHEKYRGFKRALCVFTLGASLCYCTALVAKHYGLDGEVAAVVGYLAGITSSAIYNALVRFIDKLPEVFVRKLN